MAFWKPPTSYTQWPVQLVQCKTASKTKNATACVKRFKFNILMWWLYWWDDVTWWPRGGFCLSCLYMDGLILTSVAVADKQSATCQISDSDRIIGEQDKIWRFNMEGYVEGWVVIQHYLARRSSMIWCSPQSAREGVPVSVGCFPVIEVARGRRIYIACMYLWGPSEPSVSN